MTPDPAADSPGQRPPLAGFRPVDTSGMAGAVRPAGPAQGLAPSEGRALDPATAVRFGDQRLTGTVYRGSRLLVRPTADEDALLATLTRVADEQFGLDVAVDPVSERIRALAREVGLRPEDPQPLLLRVELRSRFADGPAGPPDAWPVLQAFRNAYPPGSTQRAAVQLDHVVISHGPGGATDNGITGNPYWRGPGTEGAPYWRAPATGAGLAEYGQAGTGGRCPVAWVGPEPVRCTDEQLAGRRRPVVAVLDTGIGVHRWFPDEVVDREPAVAGLRIGLTDPTTAPEDPSVRLHPLVGELDVSAGHGTFIAGLVRQKCPDARLLAVRVLQGDTVVPEAVLLEALDLLWLRQRRAIALGRADELVDVVSMSLGYYHESADDLTFDPLLLAPLRALAALGVAVVVSAGNDATLQPMYPAAFAPHTGGAVPRPRHDEVPLVAVGATNPDRTVALVSNEGPWVHAHRPGAALVSTLPPYDGSKTPTLEQHRPGHTRRATLDPDDFSSGFGVWSGTSFASPILAGEIAQHLHASGLLDAGDTDPGRAVDRGWAAVTARVPALVRPAAPADGKR